MARRLEITLRPEQADRLVEQIGRLPGLVRMRRDRSASLEPPGDVITVEGTNQLLHALMPLLDREAGEGRPPVIVSSAEPSALIARNAATQLTRDSNDAIWEEMDAFIRRESRMDADGMGLMAAAGIVATIGLTTNTLHAVIAAMVIAPGFEPIAHIGLCLVARSGRWRSAVWATVKGYTALLAGAVAMAAALRWLGHEPLGGEGSYLPRGVLLSYWQSMDTPAMLLSVTAGATGALLIAINRSTLTLGVMIALALVPSMTLVGIGLVDWQPNLIAAGLTRWTIEVGLVVAAALAVFAWKRFRILPRDMWF